MRILTILLWFGTFFVQASAVNHVNTVITKTENGQWLLHYRTEQAANRIAFVSNPDSSRSMRWQPLNSEFEIILENEKEVIVRKDGKPFKEVKFSLMPTYTLLAKDYAPFSPFSDGGVAFYSGRFFACANVCDKDVSSWTFTLKIPADNHLILDGKLYKNKTTWLDNSGKSIYVGQQLPLETPAFIAVIDKGLPSAIKTALNQDIPKMMRYLERKLGSLQSESKPTLFASYAKVDGKYSQGGVLKNQIFIHWNIDTLEQSLKENDNFVNETLWFFAHEAAHLFQKGTVPLLAEDVNQSWLHEGHADTLAADVLITLYPEAKPYVETRRAQMKQQCFIQLKSFALINAAENGQFRAHYNCGVYIYSQLNAAMRTLKHSNADEYLVWNTFKTSVEGGAEPGQETFLDVVGRLTDETFSNKVRQFISKRNPTIDF